MGADHTTLLFLHANGVYRQQHTLPNFETTLVTQKGSHYYCVHLQNTANIKQQKLIEVK